MCYATSSAPRPDSHGLRPPSDVLPPEQITASRAEVQGKAKAPTRSLPEQQSVATAVISRTRSARAVLIRFL
jgi:hypothetical protein